MARQFKTEMRQWSKGAMVADSTASKVPIDSASRARNTAWLKSGFPAKRKGCPILTPSAQSGQHPILRLGNALGLNWVIDDLGRWSKVDLSNGTFSAIDGAAPTPFTAGTKFPSFAVAKSLLFAVNGTDAKKTDGTHVFNFGIASGAAGLTAVDSGVAGNPNGTYQFALTYYDSNTGAESSLGTPVSVTVAGKKITVSWTFPAADTQVTTVRVHIFKNGLTTNFFQLVGADVVPAADGNGGYNSGTVSITVNVTDADINNLIIKSPSATENNPPPAGTTYICWHGGRMFATDGNYLYYSKSDKPEAFDPNNFEIVNTNDDQKILAMVSLADYQLLILKSRSCHLLTGPNDPNTWEIQDLDPTIGLTSIRAIILSEGAVWWEAIQGLFRLKYSAYGASGKPERVDSPSISDRLENLNDAATNISTGAYDSIHQRLFFAVPDVNSATRNTEILPFNTKIGVFEDVWDPMDVSCLGTFVDSNNVPFVAIGNYKGRIFKLYDTPYVDGVRIISGSTFFTLQGTVTSATANTLTDSGATFDTTADALSEIVVVAIDPNGQAHRNIIASNTGTVLTLNGNWDVTPAAGWTYYVGSPFFEFDTQHLHPTSVPGNDGIGAEFYTRSFKRALVRGTTDTGQTVLDIYAIVDGDLFNFANHVQVPIASGGAQWDIDLWDVGKFGQGNIITSHVSLGVRGKTCALRVRNITPNTGALILSLGLYGTEHGYKS